MLSTVRGLLSGLGSWTLALVATALAVALVVQLAVAQDETALALGGGESGWGLDTELGYGVISLAAVTLLAGSRSSRFPASAADIAWLYPAPISTRSILIAQFLLQAAVRSTLWLLTAVVLDVVSMVAPESPNGSFSAKAVRAVPLLVALTALGTAAGTARGSRLRALASTVTGVVLAIVLAVPLLDIARGTKATHPLAHGPLAEPAASVGAILSGRYDVAGVAAVTITLAVALAAAASVGLRLREQMVLDAAFWADFKLGTVAQSSTLGRSKPSMPRIGWLRGPAALLWFELAVLRRANYQVWSYLVLVLGAILTGELAGAFVPLFAVLSPFGALASAYLSGLAVHLRMATFQLTPGRLSLKWAAAEALHLLGACFSLAVGVGLAGTVAGLAEDTIAGYLWPGLGAVLLAFGGRVLAAALSVAQDGSLPSGTFHRNLVLTGTLAAAVLWGASRLASALGGGVATVVLLDAVGASALAGVALSRLRIALPPGPTELSSGEAAAAPCAGSPSGPRGETGRTARR